MKNILSIVPILCLALTSCVKDASHFYHYGHSSGSLASGSKGIDMTKNTPEAAEARQYATADILEAYAPNNCSFNQYKTIYQCDDEKTFRTVNARVPNVREKIDTFIRLNGRPSTHQQREDMGNICLLDLYNCEFRDENPRATRFTLYCNAEFSTSLTDYAREDGWSWLRDLSYRKGYKYIVTEL